MDPLPTRTVNGPTTYYCRHGPHHDLNQQVLSDQPPVFLKFIIWLLQKNYYLVGTAHCIFEIYIHKLDLEMLVVFLDLGLSRLTTTLWPYHSLPLLYI